MIEWTVSKKQNRNQELLFVLLFLFIKNNIARIFVFSSMLHVYGIVSQLATADNNSIQIEI